MSRILVTGAAGAVGSALVAELASKTGHLVIATDVRPLATKLDGIDYETLDVRDAARAIELTKGVDTVVHLASIVSPGGPATRDFEYSVDVEGSRNILDACIANSVKRLVVTSSGAAYGYHADNSVPLTEDDPVRGNEEFAYSHHKRLVEQMLADARATHHELEQVVLRVGTILGKGMDNQITALFRRPRLLGVSGSDSPFVFIWNEDLARILVRAAADGPPGIYNVAGDGALSVDELAKILGKPVLKLPAWLLKAALAVAKPLGLTQYGPEQVRFLQYRPVLDNTRLKTVFGFTPKKTSRQVFEDWAAGEKGAAS